MDKTRRLITNSMVNVLQNPVSMIIQIVLTPFVLNTLGKSAYGIWTLTGSTLAYIAQLRAGLNSAVSYHVPRYHQNQDADGINRVVSTVFGFYAVVTALGAVFIAVVVWRFPIWFSVPAELWTTSRLVALIAGIGLEVTILTSVYSGVLAGLQRYDVMVGSRLGFVLVRALGIVAILTLGAGLIGIAGVSVGIEIATAVWMVTAAHKLLPSLKVERRLMDRRLLPGLMAYSTSSLMFGSGQLILSQAGKILVGFLYTPAAVTDFSIPFVLLMMVGGFVLALTRAIKPMITLLDAMEEQGKVQQLFLWGTKYSMMIAVPGALSFVLFGGDVLRAWIGSEYGGPGGTLLAIMAVPQMLRVSQVAGYSVVTGLGRHRYFGISILVQAASGLALAYVLAEPMGLGLIGIAIGISIPEVIGCGYFIPRYCNRVLGLRATDQFRQSVVPAVLCNVPVLAYLLIVHLWFPIDSRLELLATFGLGGIVWLAGAWFLGLSPREKARLTDFIEPVRRKFFPK